jgi:hypothetical protein
VSAVCCAGEASHLCVQYVQVQRGNGRGRWHVPGCVAKKTIRPDTLLASRHSFDVFMNSLRVVRSREWQGVWQEVKQP